MFSVPPSKQLYGKWVLKPLPSHSGRLHFLYPCVPQLKEITEHTDEKYFGNNGSFVLFHK